MSVSELQDSWVWLARIRRPQGRKGEVFAEILTDFPEKFSERKRVWLLPSSLGATLPEAAKEPQEIEINHHWQHKGGIVLHFAGVDSITAAESLAGMTVAVPRAERASLADDEVHIADLIGCTVVDVAGASPVAIGVIENVDRTAGPVPLMIVRGGRGEILIPFAKGYLRKLDLEAQRIEMALPEGLTDLNP